MGSSLWKSLGDYSQVIQEIFNKIAHDVSLTFEETSTLIIQIEVILNSRPLIAISYDPNALSYISAGHFLIGDTIVSYILSQI